jgi:DNA topoisomerase IB
VSDPKDIALHYLALRVAKTFTVNKGDLVWYGKYKNQRGIVKNFGMSNKGDPTVTVEQLPAPSARKPKKKSPKEMNLFKIRPRKEDEHDKARKEAVSKARSKKEVPKADGSGTTTVYEYGPRQVARRNKEKAVRIEALRKKMGDLRKHIHADLTAEDLNTRLTALAVSLIDETYARVGNEKSAKEGHHGVTNWQTDHVTLADKSATIRYTGKSGVKQAKRITNPRVLAALRKALKGKGKGDKILCDGDECDVLAKDVNAYLKPFEITAKDIRGMHANEEMKHHLQEQRKAGPADLPRSRKERDKILKAEFKAALDLAAAAVGHEGSTLRSQYLVPSMEASYTHDGTVLDRLDKTATLSDSEKEDRESERLVRQSPKFKPPRKDKERGRIKDTSTDTDTDEAQDQKDRSNNYKDAAARVVLRYLVAGSAKSKRRTKRKPSPSEVARRQGQSARDTGAARTGPKPVPAAPPSSPGERVERDVGQTWKDDKGKWSAKGKEKTQSGFASQEAAKKWLVESSPPEGDEGGESAPGAPGAPKPPAKKKGPLTRAQKREMVETLSDDLAQEAGSTLSKLPEALLRAVAGELGEPAKAVVDAMLGDTASLEERATFAKATLKRIPSGKPPTDKQVASAEALLAKHEEAGTSLGGMEDELGDLEDSTPDRSHEDYAAHNTKVTALKAEVKAFQKAEKTVEAEESWGDAPSPKEIADALVATRAAEVRKDPLLLDLADPLTNRSKEPLALEGGAQKEFMDKMGDLTVSAMSEYREMPAGDRKDHQQGLQDHLKELDQEGATDTEQYHATLAQLRGLQVAAALVDGDAAKDVNPAFQTLLKAAEVHGPAKLREFVKLNVTGAAEGDDSAQMQFRNLLRDTDPQDLKNMVPEDHPAQVALEALTGGGFEGKQKDIWMKNMDSESMEMLQELAEDMILDEVLFTDMNLVRSGKTTGEIKKDKGATKNKRERREKFRPKIVSVLDQLKKKWSEEANALLDTVSSGYLGKAKSRPTPKNAHLDLVCAYDFDPWGVILSPQNGNPPR